MTAISTLAKRNDRCFSKAAILFSLAILLMLMSTHSSAAGAGTRLNQLLAHYSFVTHPADLFSRSGLNTLSASQQFRRLLPMDLGLYPVATGRPEKPPSPPTLIAANEPSAMPLTSQASPPLPIEPQTATPGQTSGANSHSGQPTGYTPGQIAPLSGIVLLLALVSALFLIVARQRRLTTELKQQHLLLRVLIDAIPDQIYFKNMDGTLVACNQAALSFLGRPADQIIGKTDREIFGQSNDELLKQHVFDTVGNTGQLVSQGEFLSPNGDKRVLEMIKVPVIDEKLQRLGSVGVWRDITGRRQDQEKIEALAYSDPLTQIANRAKAKETLEESLITHRQQRQFMALAIFDVDKFSAINSIFGHEVGDALLHTIALRLKKAAQSNLFVARLSSDTFLLLIPMLGFSAENAQVSAQAQIVSIQKLLSERAFLKGRQISASVSIGAMLVKPDTAELDDCLRHTDLAMHKAKSVGRGKISWYELDMSEDLAARFEIESVLEHALANKRFALYLQPKVMIHEDTRHFEVLLRLDHPSRGIVGPGEFINILENTGMILQVGGWVLRQTIVLLKQHSAIHLAVNVSVQQILQEDFAWNLRHYLAESEVDAGRLTIEVTESLMIADFDLALSQLRQIRALGVRLSVDDFGTGYSALVYLKQLPLNEVKLDQTFIRGIPHETRDTSLAELVRALTHHLDLLLVAEGVETEEQALWLRGKGFDCLQGYLYGRPQPVDFYLPVG